MIIIIGFVIAVSYFLIKIWNLVKPLSIAVDEANSNVLVILEKRTSILTKLNEVVNSYSTYERDIVQKLSTDMGPTADSLLTINRLYDAYPDLKLNSAFKNQVEKLYLVETEKQNYLNTFNYRVRQYNEASTLFPNNLACRIFGFNLKPFFS